MIQFLKKNRLLWIHLFFWCLYFSFFFYGVTNRRRGDEDLLFESLLDAVLQTLVVAAISYFNYFVLLTRFLKHRRTLQYILEIGICIVLIVLFQQWVKKTIYFDVLEEGRHFFNSSRFYIMHSVNIVFVLGIISMFRFAKDWFELDARKKEVENIKLNAELKFLKEQVNPHFLFNTLNNLYYLALSKSEKTTEVISELSQMMRYMIYDANQDFVPVTKEIEYLENYISLEKLRLEESVVIDFEVQGSAAVLKVTPNVFLTFLENAFKHGLADGVANAWIKIKLSFDGNKCEYIVENSIPDHNSNDGEAGIGLKNVKRRLNLLYPEKHSLKTETSEGSYKVVLNIEL